MAEVVKEDSQEPKKKSVFTKLKEKAGDSEEHLAILSNFVRLGVLIWSGGILTLNYVTIPGLRQRLPRSSESSKLRSKLRPLQKKTTLTRCKNEFKTNRYRRSHGYRRCPSRCTGSFDSSTQRGQPSNNAVNQLTHRALFLVQSQR